MNKIPYKNEIKCVVCDNILKINEDNLYICNDCNLIYDEYGNITFSKEWKIDDIIKEILADIEYYKQELKEQNIELTPNWKLILFMRAKDYLIYNIINKVVGKEWIWSDGYFNINDEAELLRLRIEITEKIWNTLKHNIEVEKEINGISFYTCPFCILDEYLHMTIFNEVDNYCEFCLYKKNHSECGENEFILLITNVFWNCLY